MAAKDQCSAFPVQTVVDANQNIHWGSNGMDLRDYFAGKALQGILAQHEKPDLIDKLKLAIDCYNFSDAMMEARKL